MKAWREAIDQIYAARINAAGTESRPIYSPPASVLDIEAAENRLGVRLPESLKSLLLESDGIMEQLSIDGGPFFDNIWVVWPVQQMVAENIEFRRRVSETSSNFGGHELVCIANAGVDGILFGIESTDMPRDDSPIVSWYPIGQRTCDLAETLASFLNGWLSNCISV